MRDSWHRGRPVCAAHVSNAAWAAARWPPWIKIGLAVLAVVALVVAVVLIAKYG